LRIVALRVWQGDELVFASLNASPSSHASEIVGFKNAAAA
jgi:hypothetical protein